MHVIFSLFNKFLEFILVFSISGIMLSVCLQVFARATFGALSWPEELSVILMVWGLLLGGAYVLNERGHVGITMLVDSFGPHYGAMISAMVHLLIIVFSLFVITSSYEAVGFVWKLKTGALGVSRAIPNLAIPCAFSIYILISIRLMYEDLCLWRKQ